MAEKKSDGTVKLDVKGDAAAAPKAAPKTTPKAPKAQVPETNVVGLAQAVVATDMVKKPEFLDKVVARCGVKRSDAKSVMEACLAELSDVLLRGDDVNLPPMGKIKVIKDKPLNAGAHALTLKLRTMKTVDPAAD